MFDKAPGCSALAAVLVFVSLAAPLPAGSAPPTHLYYNEERLELALETDELAVRFRTDSPEAAQLAASEAVGVAAYSATSFGVSRWSTLEVASPMTSAEDAHARIEALLRSPEVEFVSPILRDPDGGTRIMMQEVVVRFAPGFAGDARSFLFSEAPELSLVNRRVGTLSDAYLMRSISRNGFDVLATANRLAERPDVRWAEPAMLIGGTPGLIPNDPLFPAQWPLKNGGGAGATKDMDMAADIAWEITTGTPVGVLILDSGIQQDHPDLTQFAGMDFTSDMGDGGPVNSCDNHGTAVAGTVGGTIDNALGLVGVAPDARTVAARVCIQNPAAGCPQGGTCASTWVVNALEWAFDQGYRVTNFSWSGIGSSLIRDTYDATRLGGMVHFSSSGNDGVQSIGTPASYPSVNAISAVDNDGDLATFSNYGSAIMVAAPGVSVLTTDRTGSAGYGGDDYTTANGTSFSSPYAAGVAALAISVNPDRTAAQVERIMKRTAMDLGPVGRDIEYGSGFVNANGVVRYPTRRVTLRGNGTESDDWSGEPALSELGRHIVFSSDATTLITSDDNGVRDVYSHDRYTARTKRISLDSSAGQATGASEDPSVSEDGRFVVFESVATDLVALDQNSQMDIFLRDRDTDENGVFDGNSTSSTARVNLTETGGEASGGDSYDATISGDGSLVAFTSEATNLVTGDNNGQADIFLRDVVGSTTVRVSIPNGGGEADSMSGSASISADGLHVAFASDATNLVAGDNNEATDIFVRDLNAGTTIRVSVASGGAEGTGHSVQPDISGDGRYVVFASTAADLVVGDGNGVSDVFMHDRDPDGNGTFDEGNGTTERVSVTSAGTEATGASTAPSVSDDGSQVAFESEASEFGFAGTLPAVFVRNRDEGVTFLVSKSSLEVPGGGTSPAMSGNGRIIGYASSSILTPFDANGAQDVLIFQDNPCTPPAITGQPIDQMVDLGDPVTLAVSASGTTPSFQWRRNGSPIAGATFPNYVIDSVTGPDLGTYDVIVSNHCGMETSVSASLSTSGTDAEILQGAGLSTLLLERPAPSPFSASTRIRFGLSREGDVDLAVYDVSGRRITTLLAGRESAGWRQVHWDGRDRRGALVASGIYFVRLEAPDGVATQKLVRID